jgi:hypothetical protein
VPRANHILYSMTSRYLINIYRPGKRCFFKDGRGKEKTARFLRSEVLPNLVKSKVSGSFQIGFERFAISADLFFLILLIKNKL